MSLSKPSLSINLLIGLVLVLFTSQSLCFSGLLIDSLNVTTQKAPIRSPRSPSSPPPFSFHASNSNGTNPQKGLPVSLGLLVATSNTSANSYCIAHFNHETIPHEPQPFYNLIKMDKTNFCSIGSSPSPYRDDSFILINFNTKCPLAEQALNVATYYPKSKGLIISLPNDVNVYNLYVQKNITDPAFIIAVIGEDSTADIFAKFGDSVRAFVYAPTDDIDDTRGIFDSSLMGIWCIAVFTVAIGGHSSGILRYGIFLNHQIQEIEREIEQLGAGEGEDEESGRKKKKRTQFNDSSLDVTPVTVVFFVIYMCVVLLILYFFYSRLVFMMIIFFTVFCTISIYSLITGLTVGFVAPHLTGKWSMYGWRVSITLLSAIAPAIWFFTRKSNHAWSLQNGLAIVFCVHVLQMLRFPNFKVTSLLLSLLFVYDIFFVFLTPYLTNDGESIMVKVANGGASESAESSFSFGPKTLGDSLPVVFQWPRATTSMLIDKCYQGRAFWTSKLGFGDVLVPGFLISYCLALDLFQKTPFRLYFCVEVIFYGLGLFVTFIALHLMDAAQPALLYLVPATLIPPLVIAWFRNELNILWYGPEAAATEALRKERQLQVNQGEARLTVNNIPAESANANNANASLVTNQPADSANNQNAQNS